MDTSIDKLLSAIRQEEGPLEVTGLSGPERAYLISRISLATQLPLVVVLPTPKEAENFLDAFYFFTRRKGIPCHYFPSYNLAPYKFFAYHSETAAKRIAALYRIRCNAGPHMVVTTPETLIQKIIPWEEMNDYAERVIPNEILDREVLISKLIAGGYARTPLAEEPGDFSVRGGIIDVFSPYYADPIRIEFFGNLVDTVRSFSAATQRTTGTLAEAVILPAREVVLRKEHFNQIAHRIRLLASQQEIPVTKVRDVLAQIGENDIPHGIESLLPLIYDAPGTLFSYAPGGARFILMEPDEIRQTAEAYHLQARINFNLARSEGRICAPPEALLLPWEEALDQINATRPISVRSFQDSLREGGATFPFSVTDNSELTLRLKAHRDQEHLLLPLKDWISDRLEKGTLPLMVCAGKSQAERLNTLLTPYGIDPVYSDGFPDLGNLPPTPTICTGRLTEGFIWKDAGIALLTEKEIFGGAFRKRKKLSPQIQTQLLAVEDLAQDDLVVHQEHGIGRYQGLTKLTLNGTTNDFLLLTYKDGDRLYLPVDRMNMIQKYMGVDGIDPVLDKLGGKTWEKVREKVKASTEKIAGELLELYAARQVEKGVEFFVPELAYHEFEAAFPYEETPDQSKAINDVLADMEQERPMDRLVCGDVGYGKTEVALRAAFVAVNNGKQVAVLVPTTVLAEQHFSTFKQRFERHPLIVECISRFRSNAEQKEILTRLKEGKIDVIIGTHRLFSKDVVFRDLGLMVLDEEQRFGVKHKEKLKKLRRNVDVLTLTATPIPRTLHLSLMGMRDISVISTPPEQRHPIITYVTEYDDATVAEAIRKELARKGQIFFVHNHVASIYAMADRIQKLVPEASVGVAHGQLGEEDLEKAMVSFMTKETDLLVCTTIIESGLDISAANTILINRADRFGLAQIYQMRGRVGRSDEQAYAYLFIPADSVMGKDAQKRLKVLMEHSDLGSGFQIAMSDLKIRGGGSILGANQSGHIAAVGYDMFLKLMENSMAELKGEPLTASLDPEINIPLSAYLPEGYVPDIDQRLAAYRRLAKITEPKEIIDFKGEMLDRFGELPAEAANLLMKIMLRVLCIKGGIRRLDLAEKQLLLYFSTEHQRNPMALIELAAQGKGQIKFLPGDAMKVVLSSKAPQGLLSQTKNILKEIALRVNPDRP